MYLPTRRIFQVFVFSGSGQTTSCYIRAYYASDILVRRNNLENLGENHLGPE